MRLPCLFVHRAAQALDFLAVDGLARQHHLEAVVILGIVAAGHLNAALAQRGGCKVQHGRGDHAHIDHLDAHVHQPGHQLRRERRAGQTSVAAHGHHALALGQRRHAKGPAQIAGNVFVQSAGNNAANVIGFEYGWRKWHETTCDESRKTATIVGVPNGVGDAAVTGRLGF
ncbi:hypothetical protein SDC9_125491 [bioreactor metagenome]|uniref:Uncharacterized protein n=1 Tax=bioreactor metagenome TaxID=1076179 RepID=A0A645CN56_9ZZZZ